MSRHGNRNSSRQEERICYDRRVLLIRSIRQRPRLYKYEFLRTPQLQRQEKQKLWDEVACEAKYKSK